MLFWVHKGTISSKMIENISIVNFHTLPYHKMTHLGLWRANLGPKLTLKRSNLTWFCNNLQFFTHHLYQPYKHIEISLFAPNQTSMVIYECIMAISMSKMDPKKGWIWHLSIQFLYLSPNHIYMVLFTSDEAPMVCFRHFVVLPRSNI